MSKRYDDEEELDSSLGKGSHPHAMAPHTNRMFNIQYPPGEQRSRDEYWPDESIIKVIWCHNYSVRRMVEGRGRVH